MEFCGKWKLKSSQNFEAFLAGCGVNRVKAKLGMSLTPTILIATKGLKQMWTIMTITIVKSSSFLFYLNREENETTIDGREVKTTVTLEVEEANQDHKKRTKLVQTQIDKDGRNILVVRTLELEGNDPSVGDIMNVHMEVGDVSSDAVFVRSELM